MITSATCASKWYGMSSSYSTETYEMFEVSRTAADVCESFEQPLSMASGKDHPRCFRTVKVPVRPAGLD